MVLKEQTVNKTVKRNILLNPGPSTTTETVKASLIQGDICHREEEFASITRKVCDDLVKVVHWKYKRSRSCFFLQVQEQLILM